MSEKVFKKFKAKDYLGVDGETSAIEDADGYFADCLNYESAISDSLRGRVGCQAAGGPGYFFGVFPYNYTRTQDQYDITYDAANTITGTKTAADGATISKLIAINQQCWTLDTMNIVITQTVAGTYTWYTTVGSSVINLVIQKNGTNILSTSLGNATSSNTTIYSLLGTIDALADLSVSRTTRGTCPPFAIVNGAQTTAAVAGSTYGTTYSVTVANTPHNFYPGDIICFPQCTINGGTLNGVTTMAAGIVRTRTATLITYMGPQVVLTDGLVLGYMGQSAVGHQITAISSESGGVFTLSIPYWRCIPEGPNAETYNGTGAITVATDYGHIFTEAMYLAQNKTSASFYAPPNVVNSDNNLYIATSTRQSPYEQYLGANSIYKKNSVYQTLYNSLGVVNSLVKCDGQQLYRSGIYEPTGAGPVTGPTVTAIAGATLTGTYKYKMYLRRYDAQGNFTDGQVSAVKTLTYAAPNQTGQIETHYIGNPQYWGYGERSAWKVTNQVCSPTAFTIDDGNGQFPYFQPGDVCCFLDSSAQTTGLTIGAAGVLGTTHVSRCTFYDGTGATAAIKVSDTTGGTIIDNTPISSGLTLIILRTTAGGNQFYQMAELPIHSWGFTGSFLLQDNVTDATLSAKAQYIEAPIGKERDPAFRCSLVCAHQGGLVVSRNFNSPNTVSFSIVGESESFPVASNSFDVPSTQSTHISAIASDTDDRLAVFKSRAYYDVVGDLDGGVFSVNVKNEGDYGIASHASLVRVRESLVGLSMNGLVAIKNGVLDHALFNKLNAKIIDQDYFFQWATAVNDHFERCYICSIPITTTGSTSPISFIVEYDSDTLRTFDRTYDSGVDQGAGAVMIGDVMYHLSQKSPYCVFRRLQRFTAGLSGGGNTDSFIDNVGPIFYQIVTRPMCLGEPAEYKTPIRLRAFSIPNEGVVDGWVGFSFEVYTVASWSRNYYGASNPGSTVSTITFSGLTPTFKDIQLVHCKTFFYLMRLDTYTIRTSPFLTSYELEFAVDYVKEDLMK